MGTRLEDDNARLTEELEESKTHLRYARDEIHSLRDANQQYMMELKSYQVKEISLGQQVRSAEDQKAVIEMKLQTETDNRRVLERELSTVKEELEALQQRRYVYCTGAFPRLMLHVLTAISSLGRSTNFRDRYKGKMNALGERMADLRNKKLKEKDKM